MTVTIYNAISIDGYIAKVDGDSDWVSPVDAEQFEKAIDDADCVIVGKTTFEQYKGDLYPVPLKLNIVMTSLPPETSSYENVEYFTQDPRKVLEHLEKKGCKNILIVGGGKTNYGFIRENLVDFLIVDIHPIAFGKGISLFEGEPFHRDFELLHVNQLKEGLVQIVYKKLTT
jgi:dihydrofolate reductase